MLSLKGAIVTIEAMGMQKAIVSKIREHQADYVIALKDNQPTLATDMSQLLDEGCRTGFAELTTDVHTTVEEAQGRTEQRDVRVIEIPEDSPHRQVWKDLRTLAVVLKRTERDRLESFETRFYLSSLPPNAKLLSGAICSHWRIESSLHWSMDVTFREDAQSLPIDQRTCKHLRQYRGETVEMARLGNVVTTVPLSERNTASAPPLLLAESWTPPDRSTRLMAFAEARRGQGLLERMGVFVPQR